MERNIRQKRTKAINRDNFHTNTLPFREHQSDQRRQKAKKPSRNDNKNSSIYHQSSSKSFRIKQINSSTSLHKFTLEKDNNSTKNAATKLIKNFNSRARQGGDTVPHQSVNNKRQIKARSFDREFNGSIASKTITTQHGSRRNSHIRPTNNTQQKGSKDNNSFFNDYFLKIRADRSKNRSNLAGQSKPKTQFRKNLYQKAPPSRNTNNRSQKNSSAVDFSQISYTHVNIDRSNNYPAKKQQTYLKNSKKTQVIRKNNFRRGKYEYLHSSVHQKPVQDKHVEEPLLSERLYGLDKKQSNLSINQQMDIIAQKQMQTFYRQIRAKEIQKSLQKSTEKYFGNDSYRPTKSKNDIQCKQFIINFLVFVSTVGNPSTNKVSQSTQDRSIKIENKKVTGSGLESKQATTQQLYLYDFDFHTDRSVARQQQQLNEIVDDSSFEQSSQALNNRAQSDEFEKQRKKVQIQYYQKQQPSLDWSDDNCQIQDI